MAVEAQFHSGNPGFTSCQDFMASTQCFGLAGEVEGDNTGVFLHHQQQQQQQVIESNQLFMNQNLGSVMNNSGVSSGGDLTGGVFQHYEEPMSDHFSQSLTSFEKQRRDIDLYLHLQNERLRYAIQSHRNQQLPVFLQALESKATTLLKEKQNQINKSRDKTKHLQDLLMTAEMERDAWVKVAKQNKAIVIALNSTIEQVKEKIDFAAYNAGGNGSDDAESVCDGNVNEEDGSGRIKKLLCRWCNYGDLCVVFLPCKHLCSCKICEPVLQFCPVCRSCKQGSIEVFFS